LRKKCGKFDGDIEMTETKYGSKKLDEAVIARAAEVIRAGGLVVYPTETVYGLAADAKSDTAVRRVFLAKGRPKKPDSGGCFLPGDGRGASRA
jgi:tRNA A37 threonylcarbamoyladenosine synthetase subunit TsaC/SUA5/YrdC